MQGYAGALRYFGSTVKRGILLIFILMAAIVAGMFLVPIIFKYKLDYTGINDNGVYFIFIIVTMFRAARKDTIFLTSRPVARRSLFLAVMTEIIALSAILAISIIILQNLGYMTNEALKKNMPEIFGRSNNRRFFSPFYPRDSLSVMKNLFIRYIPVGVFSYAYACFLTRWKGWTIGISVGIPVLLIVLMLLPTVQEFLNDIEQVIDNNNRAAAMLTVPKWIDILSGVVNWFRRNWKRVYWTACACCVPLSFLVMRTTRHSGM